MTTAPIAIVGRSCVLPGALNPDELWAAVVQGRDLLTSAPPTRWRTHRDDTRCNPGEDSSDRTWSDRGGYVSGFEQIWDPAGFAVAESELAGLDPLFLWTLHCAREALRDAGDHRTGVVDRSRVGAVFGNLGFPTGEMTRLAEATWFGDDEPPDPRNRFMSGGAARLLERALGLAPGVFCLDAACASSLVAIKLACDQLHDGRIDVALAGAVNRADDLFIHIGFCALNALSPTGRSRPFHAGADGLVPAEGAAFVALKRLPDAIRDGDTVHGVIRGIGLSNDGRGRGFLAPSVEGQLRALRMAYRSAGLEPGAISLLECHATGTSVGDAAEISSTAALFEGCRAVPLGSLKSNLGHLVTVAGLAALLKVIEALRSGTRPATLHADEPNPALDDSPFRLLQHSEAWDCDGPRIAGISAFGFGGNNAHLIVGQASDDPASSARPEVRHAPEPLAVVGLGTVVGTALDRGAFTEALLAGESLVPQQRRGPSEVRTGTFELDLRGLRFPPKDLQQTLPQQLLLLKAALEAVEGIAELSRERTGVFVGMEPDAEICRHGARWRLPQRLREGGHDPEQLGDWIAALSDDLVPSLEAAGVVGTMPNISANRLNSQLDLGGGSCSVSAGEGSGRRALELAARALRAGELDAALIGAVDLSCEPVHTTALRAVEGSDGAPAGDAAVVLVLKRLHDAREADDGILAVLRPGDGDGSTAEPVDAGELSDRFGRSWAGGGLRDLAAAVLATSHRVFLDGRPWLPRQREPRALEFTGHGFGPVMVHAEPGQYPVDCPGAPGLFRFGGTDRRELLEALGGGHEGGPGPCRLVIVASGPEQLAERAERARQHLLDGSPAGPGIHFREQPLPGELAFVFAGAGAAYHGMGRELLQALPSLSDALLGSSDRLAESLSWAYEPDADPTPLQRLWGSSALCQVHARLSQELLELRPDAVIGYSSGESNSLFATGIWSDLEQMIEDSEASGLFTAEIGGELRAVRRAWDGPAAWQTWTVLVPVDEVRAAVEDEPRVHLAVIHSDRDCIVSGDPEGCARVVSRVGPNRCIRLHYDLAVHVPELEQVETQWLDLHRRAVSPRPDLRVYSGAHDGPYEPGEEACAQAILGQAIRTLDFRALIERAYQDGVRIFVEHGPQGSCSRWIGDILGEREALVVSLDRKGAGLEGLLDAVAALLAAGLPLDPEPLLSRLRPAPPEHASHSLAFAAHPPAVEIPPLPSPPEHIERAPAQGMPPAPRLPAVSSLYTPQRTAAVPAQGAQDAHLALLRQQVIDLGATQQAYLTQQAELHRRFLAIRSQAVTHLVDAAHRAAAPRPEPGGSSVDPTSVEAVPAPVPDGLPRGPSFDRGQLEIHASGRISEIYGTQFEVQDRFERQVRMPQPPLLLADRVTGLDADPGSMELGTIWTETDVLRDSWYLHQGRMPAGIMIEAGQADLMLISYLGVDLTNRGERVYRLLGCTLTYHGDLPRPGETLGFDIHIDGHATQGDVRLMFFHYDCRIDGAARLSVRGGQAGFFTDQELADSDGCLWTTEEQEIVDEPPLAPPPVPCQHTRFGPEQVRAFADGRPWDCFGPGFEGTQTHTRTPRIQDGRMLLLDEVLQLDPRGGPWQRGYLRAQTAITPDHWFFSGHFKNDPCMPGTLMFEACLQALAFYLTGLGFTVDRDGWRFQPVQEQPFTLSCRGQVTPTSQQVVYEVFVEELIGGEKPTVYADLLCTVDGLKAFHARRVGLELVPDWPLDDHHELLDGILEPKPVAHAGDFPFDHRSLLACAWGRPSEAFGPIYERFDSPRRVARLPGPPYHFITRVRTVEGELGAMQPGCSAEVEYDIPPDAWYFEHNGHRTMPFAVLLEAALQPCGWLASYIGCALSVEGDLRFRNLDGTGEQLAELGPDAGTLRTRVASTGISKTAGMIIVSFEVECRAQGQPVYRMETVFGFFPEEALANQVGLPTTPAQLEVLDAVDQQTTDLTERPAELWASGRPHLADPMLLMIDRITLFDPQGGAAGLGLVRAEKDIDAGEWFFKAHFFQDPVQPGSLGIEAMIQLLQWTMLHSGMDEGIDDPHFEPLALRRPLTWKYRGQVMPHNRTVTTTIEIVESGRDDRGAYAVAEASLWVDGTRIYEATGLGMRIVGSGAAAGQRITLDPDREPWIADHCPTWTIPALPMMSMADLLARGAGGSDAVIGLRDMRVKDWLLLDGPRILRTRRQGDLVRLLAAGEGDEVEIAAARVLQGRYPEPPEPWAALEGEPGELPYDSGALFHGPAFQVLQRLVRRPGAASSLLRADSGVPVGLLNPALLDGALHGIPHDRLPEWDEQLSPDVVAYPAILSELDLYGPTPEDGTVRCEVRTAGCLGSPDLPVFRAQLIVGERVWCQLRWVEACFPKGPLGAAPPEARRAFLRDGIYAEGLRLSRSEDGASRLTEAEVCASDWLDGTVERAYGTRDVAEIARRDHIAAAHELHPRIVPRALPLTAWDLEVTADGAAAEVRGDGRGRLDIGPVREFWTRWFDRPAWPVEDLYYGLIERFVRRVVLADPDAFAAVRGRSLLFLGNHQVGVESLLFSIIASGLSEVPTVTLAKIEHQATWLGRLIAHCFSYPGVTDPRVITFFDRADKTSLMRIVGELAAEMMGPGRSVMVHIEGTRSLSCRVPVQKMSGAFIDMALQVGAPVVPIRFAGGLPAEPLPKRLEFPLGMGRQDIWIGRPLLPEELAEMHYGQRKEVVIGAINALGPPNESELPQTVDPDFEAAVASWQERRGVDHEHATLGALLAERPDPDDGIRRLLAADSSDVLAADGSPEGLWLAELGRRLLGR